MYDLIGLHPLFFYFVFFNAYIYSLLTLCFLSLLQAKRRGSPLADPTVGGDGNIESMREERRHFMCANSKNKAGCYLNHHSDAKDVFP